MNLFSKKYIIIAVLLILISPKIIFAINIHGLYVSSCERLLGVILEVDKTKVKLLTLNGEFKEISRHEIIYLTYYSIDSFPDVKTNKSQLVNIVEIDTIQNNKIVNLVKGWPIDYSEGDISFLTLEGHEVLISRENIFRLNLVKSEKEIKFRNNNSLNYNFIHPYPFRLCPDGNGTSDNKELKTLKVYPQQMLNDSVQIKLELDRLYKGRERIDQYNTYQQFYAVPQVYKNRTSLGYWFSYGSRYGASKSRNNNLTPILQNEFSSGIFGYQHILLTGSAPLFFSVHEEIQTQFYYRFKADYFHMGMMFDPNLFLVPWEKYKWKDGDLQNLDDGVNPTFALEMGIDYQNFTLQWYMDSLNVGVRDNNLGYYGSAGSFRFGLSYQNHLFKTEIQFDPFAFMKNRFYDYTEETKEDNADIIDGMTLENQVGVARFNLETSYFNNVIIRYSMLYRRIKYRNLYNGFKVGDTFTATNEIKNKMFEYQSHSLANALYFIKTIQEKYNIGGYISIEYHTAKSKTISNERDNKNVYPKCGVYASLFF